MTTLQPLTLSLFEDELPSCQEDFPVRTSARQVKAQDYRANVQDYGSPCLTLFPESNLGLFWLRMSLPSIVEALTPYSAAWKKRATPQNRSWWQLQTWERLTDANESLSSLNFPIPTASDAWTENMKSSQTKPGSMHSMTLPKAVNLNWGTPTSFDANDIQRSPEAQDKHLRRGGKYYRKTGGNLAEEVKNWITPTAVQIQRSDMEKRTAYRASIGRKYLAGTLEEQLQNWRTPCARDHHPCIDPEVKIERGQRTDGQLMLAHQVTRKQLTPESWGTPASADAVGSHGGGQGRSLRTDIYNLKHRTEFPTPKSNKVGGYSSANFSPTLEQVVNWPTPSAGGETGGVHGLGGGTGHKEMLNASMGPASVELRSGKTLNPSWVENLMGFPQGWTDVSDSPPAPAKSNTNGKRRAPRQANSLTGQSD